MIWDALKSEDGAGEGNRTLVRSLGSSCSTIELHPQNRRQLSLCLLRRLRGAGIELHPQNRRQLSLCLLRRLRGAGIELHPQNRRQLSLLLACGQHHNSLLRRFQRLKKGLLCRLGVGSMQQVSSKKQKKQRGG